MTDRERQLAVLKKMAEDRKARKAASRKQSKARTAEFKAHGIKCAEHAAAQVGPFFCIICNTQPTEKFDCICEACSKAGNEELDSWYAAKPEIVGTF